MIKQASPRPNDKVMNAIQSVLDSGQFVKGPEAVKLENNFRKITDCAVNIAVNSGTSALNLILLALDYPNGSEIIIPVNTFMASANAVETSGYTSKFVDIDPKSLNIDVNKIEAAINEKTRAIMVVHLYGTPANMDIINEIAEKHNLDVIEDACQAHGAVYKEKKIGSIGRISAFSLFPTKNLSVLGDGGMVSTNDTELGEKVRMLRNAGRDGSHPDDAKLFGFNMRLSEILAAIGNALFHDFENYTQRRIEIAHMYSEGLSGISELQIPNTEEGTRPVWHQYTIVTPRRDELKHYLKENGIQSSIKYSIPLHLVEVYKNKYGHIEGDFPIGELACNSLLCMPMHPFMTNDEVKEVISKIKQFYEN